MSAEVVVRGGAWAVAGFLAVVSFFLAEENALLIVGGAVIGGGIVGLAAASLVPRFQRGAGKTINFSLIPISIIVAFIVVTLAPSVIS